MRNDWPVVERPLGAPCVGIASDFCRELGLRQTARSGTRAIRRRPSSRQTSGAALGKPAAYSSANQRRSPRRTRGVVNARVARNVMFRATGVCLRGDSGRAECSVLVLFFLLLDDQGLGGENQGGDRSGVAQRRAGDLDGVDDSGAYEVAVLTGRGVVALTGFEVGHLGHDDVTVLAGVLGEPAQRLDDSALDDLSTGGRIAGQSEVVSAEHLRGMDQSGSTTGDDALFDGGTSSGHGVFDAVLALLELHLG